jgi:hypothetical protein
MKTIIYNIGTLAGILPEGKTMLKGSEMNHVECIENAYLTIEDGIITDFGNYSDIPSTLSEAIAASAAVSLASARCSENIEAAMTPDPNEVSGRTSPSGAQGGRQREAHSVDYEVIDVLKIETIRMLLERNEEMELGIVLCIIYKRVFLPRIAIGRKRHKKL